MRWWGAPLRLRWGVWEHADEREEEPDPGEDVRAEMVGMACQVVVGSGLSRDRGQDERGLFHKRFGGSLKFR